MLVCKTPSSSWSSRAQRSVKKQWENLLKELLFAFTLSCFSQSNTCSCRGFSEQMHNGCGPAHRDFIAGGSRGRRGGRRGGRKNSSALVCWEGCKKKRCSLRCTSGLSCAVTHFPFWQLLHKGWFERSTWLIALVFFSSSGHMKSLAAMLRVCCWRTLARLNKLMFSVKVDEPLPLLSWGSF